MRAGRLVRIAALAALAVVASTPAFAQEVSSPAPVGATGHAIELGVGGAWTDGWGTMDRSTRGPNRVPGMGGALQLDLGARVLPWLTIGAYGFGAQLSIIPAVPAAATAYQAGAGLAGTWHMRPAAQTDPWLAIGAGWRGQWLAFLNGNATAQHGMDFLNARAGVDLRVSPSVALSPVLGAALGSYFLQEIHGGPWQAVGRPGLDTYVFAGLRATLDVPTRTRPAGASAIP